MRLENQVGSLEVGKSADFLILDRNIFRVPVATLAQTKVLQTTFEGEVVWEDGGF